MSEMTLASDEPPKSGKWVDGHDFLENPTLEELMRGNEDGKTVSYEGVFEE